MYKRLHVQYPHSFSILIKLEFSRQIFEKYSNTKCHENLSIGSRGVPYGRTDRQTDMTKLIVVFQSFAKAPKTEYCTYLLEM